MAIGRQLVARVACTLVVSDGVLAVAVFASIWCLQGAFIDVFAAVSRLTEAAFTFAVERSRHVYAGRVFAAAVVFVELAFVDV